MMKIDLNGLLKPGALVGLSIASWAIVTGSILISQSKPEGKLFWIVLGILASCLVVFLLALAGWKREPQSWFLAGITLGVLIVGCTWIFFLE